MCSRHNSIFTHCLTFFLQPSDRHLMMAAWLLGVSQSDLQKWLCNKLIVASTESILTPLNQTQARELVLRAHGLVHMYMDRSPVYLSFTSILYAIQKGFIPGQKLPLFISSYSTTFSPTPLPSPPLPSPPPDDVCRCSLVEMDWLSTFTHSCLPG